MLHIYCRSDKPRFVPGSKEQQQSSWAVKEYRCETAMASTPDAIDILESTFLSWLECYCLTCSEEVTHCEEVCARTESNKKYIYHTCADERNWEEKQVAARSGLGLMNVCVCGWFIVVYMLAFNPRSLTWQSTCLKPNRAGGHLRVSCSFENKLEKQQLQCGSNLINRLSLILI